METGKIYAYIVEAMNEYGIKTHGSVSVALKGPHRTAGGMHWVSGDMIDKLNSEELRQEYLLQHKKRNHHS